METLAYFLVSNDRSTGKPRFTIPHQTELASFVFTLTLGLIPTPAQAILQQPDRCSAVTDLQTALWDSGFDPGVVDGVFGSETHLAVESFQRAQGLVDDGVVGVNTATALGLDPYVSCGGEVAEEGEAIDEYALAAWSSTAWVNTQGAPLNVRAEPSLDSPIIDALPDGSEISIDSSVSEDWVKVSSGGWVATAWLSFQPVASSDAATTGESASYSEGSADGYITYDILPGWTIEDVAYYFESLGLFSASEFLAAASEIPYDRFGWLPDGLYDLQGFLYPDTYEIAADASPYEVIDQMLGRFESVALPAYDQSGTSLSLYDWVILSSIVEKEAVRYDEQPLIASVFLNRLDMGKRLESDPTVEYALGIQQTPEYPLTLSEVRTESPYNTYLNSGLPPAPIATPGLGSLDSVLYPAASDYLYFVACYDGTHEFNYSLEDHEQDRDTICAASRGS
jgi:UPF0755 protein